ncbi:hypothetical protein LTR53_011377 [Teratosphaeriaceae sp. CCFEE 6253]|nr:hypothetical protein LTR53_011377 [Teratosphaeriaceae sp. CCFEE 6253]
MADSPYMTFSIGPILDSKHASRLTVCQPPLNLSPETAPKVLVVSSADPDIWISHLDLHIVSAQYPPKNKDETMHLLHLLGGVLHLFTVLPTILIAEVNGLAVGGGIEFAVNMDMRFAGPGARFGIPEVAGGIVHGGGLQAVTKILGPGRAMEFVLSARAVAHREAERLGLVNRATDDVSHLREFVDALATRIATFPRGGVEGTKQGVRECLDGQGSMQKDMQRLGKLAHTAEAQKAVGGFIERGEHHKTKNAWELGMPDTGAEVWE